MKNLMQKIENLLLGKKDKPEIETRLSADEADSFFKSLGADIWTLGFPKLGNSEYRRYFRNIRATPVKINNTLITIITGNYEIQAMASSYNKKDGYWESGNLIEYPFKMEVSRIPGIGESLECKFEKIKTIKDARKSRFKRFLIGSGIAAYFIFSVGGFIKEAKNREELISKAAIAADTNKDGVLSISEVQEAYRKMGITPNAIYRKPYDRLTNDSIRYPMRNDLEKLTQFQETQ